MVPCSNFSANLHCYTPNSEVPRHHEGKLRDPSLILPGEGVEDIWEGVPKFCTIRGRGDGK